MADTYAIVIHPDFRIELVKTPGGCSEYQCLVGGHFENTVMFNLPVSDLIMTVDEEGKLKGKKVNLFATFLQGNPDDFIVGDALILKLDLVGEYNELDQLPFDKETAQLLFDFLLEMRDKYFTIAEEAIKNL